METKYFCTYEQLGNALNINASMAKGLPNYCELHILHNNKSLTNILE